MIVVIIIITMLILFALLCIWTFSVNHYVNIELDVWDYVCVFVSVQSGSSRWYQANTVCNNHGHRPIVILFLPISFAHTPHERNERINKAVKKKIFIIAFVNVVKLSIGVRLYFTAFHVKQFEQNQLTPIQNKLKTQKANGCSSETGAFWYAVWFACWCYTKNYACVYSFVDFNDF